MVQFEEKLILKNLLNNSDYFLKVFPFLEESLFASTLGKKLFKCVKTFNDMYNRKAGIPVIELYVSQKSLPQNLAKEGAEFVEYVKTEETIDPQWMLAETLSWIKRRKYYNAIMEGAEKYENGELDTTLSEKLDSAMSVTFDTTIGMGFEDVEQRWQKYTQQEEHIPLGISMFNVITNGGVTRKTLNLLMSSDSGGFKSGTMCAFSADYLKQGKNVLYISFEMSEERIMERIDANLLNVPIDDIVKMGKESFTSRILDIQSRTCGRFICKQFPTSAAHVGHIRYLLKELKLKRNFVPDVIMLDYINIMASVRLRGSDAANSYGYIKAISEEVRGLAIEYDVPIWSATQSNRGGSNNEELSVTDISESYGSIFSCDMVIGVVSTPEFDTQNKLLYVQLKNRYSDKNRNNKFFLGVDKSKMQLYELGNSEYTSDTGTIESDNREAEEFTQSILSVKKPNKKIILK